MKLNERTIALITDATDQIRATMKDGVKYNLSDFKITTKELNGREVSAIEHKSGFWFGLATLARGYNGNEPLIDALRWGDYITRTHILRDGKPIPFFTIE